jgi:hypothetical protein
MAAEREEPDNEVAELIDLLDRYKDAVAKLARIPRGTAEHHAQLLVEEGLSRQIHEAVTTQRLGAHD